MSETALLVIDVQVAMFEEPEGPCADGERLLSNVSTLVEGARSEDVDVVFVQHCESEGPFEPETRQFGIHPDVTPVEGEAVVRKWTPDSFHETDLGGVLDARGVERLVVCGLQTEHCVNATSRRAAELGYDVTLASDAHGTFDAPDLPASEVVHRHNEELGSLVRVTKTEDIAFEETKG